MQDEQSMTKEQAEKLLNFVPGSDQPMMPPELVGKTIEEIKALGAEEMGSVTLQQKNTWAGPQ